MGVELLGLCLKVWKHLILLGYLMVKPPGLCKNGLDLYFNGKVERRATALADPLCILVDAVEHCWINWE